MRNACQHRLGWTPESKIPVVTVTTKCVSRSIIVEQSGLSSDEYLDADLKAGIKDAVAAYNQEQLKKMVIDHHMRVLQDKHERVAKFETQEDCIYHLTVFDQQVNNITLL